MGLSLKISPSNSKGHLFMPATTKVELGGVDISEHLESIQLVFEKGAMPQATLSISVDTLEVDTDAIVALQAWVPDKT